LYEIPADWYCVMLNNSLSTMTKYFKNMIAGNLGYTLESYGK